MRPLRLRVSIADGGTVAVALDGELGESTAAQLDGVADLIAGVGAGTVRIDTTGAVVVDGAGAEALDGLRARLGLAT